MGNKGFLRLFLVITSFSIATSLLSPLFSPYLKLIGLGYSEISFVFSVIPLVIIIISPLIGRISDKIGRVRIVLISLLFYILALLLYLLRVNQLLLIANVFIAVTVIGIDFLLIARVQDSINRLRGTYGGFALSLKHIGIILGPALGGYLADRFSIKLVFILVIILTALIGLFLSSIKERSQKRVYLDDFRLIKNIRNLIRIRELRNLAFLGFFVQLNNPAMGIFLPLLIIDDMGLSYLKVGIALSFIGIFFAFQFVFGAISDRIGNKKSIIIGNIIACVALFLISLTSSYILLLLCLLIFSFGGAFWNPAAYSIMADIGSRTESIGEVMGVYNSIGKIGEFTGYIISGIIVAFLGIRFLFAFNGVMMFIGVIAFLIGCPSKDI